MQNLKLKSYTVSQFHPRQESFPSTTLHRPRSKLKSLNEVSTNLSKPEAATTVQTFHHVALKRVVS